VVVDGEPADAERAGHGLHSVAHREGAARLQIAYDLLLRPAVQIGERLALAALQSGQDVVERVRELGQTHRDDVGTLPLQDHVVDAGRGGRAQLPADGVDQWLAGRDERLVPRTAHPWSSPMTLTWRVRRVAPAARVRRSSASTAPSTASADPSAVLPKGPTSTASR